MKHEIELGYLILEVPDPGILTPVFADVVGLVPGEPTAAGADTWRNDRRATGATACPPERAACCAGAVERLSTLTS